jgi:serine/threonine-protein kinase
MTTNEAFELGRYRVQEEIGRGGMSVVYRAFDPALNRPVAIKLLTPALMSDSAARERFRREANAVATLKHQNIATVYEFGEQADRPFIAFEWVQGETLRELLQREGKLLVERALNIFVQVASALSYAHQRGVIHRDIKPANILIGNDDEVTIVDFGLAWMADLPSVTSTGTFFGTPLYMAPEQIEGKSVDQRADVYSLAFVLFEMLAGEPPFAESNTPALLSKQLHMNPPSITEKIPSLPLSLDAVIKRATEKNPNNRYSSVDEFKQNLERIFATQKISETTHDQRLKRIALVVVPLVLIGGVVSALMSARGVAQPSATPTSLAVVSSPAPTLAEPKLEPTFEPTPEPTQAPQTSPTPLPLPNPDAMWVMVGGNSQNSRGSTELKQVGKEPRWRRSFESESLGAPAGMAAARGRIVATYEDGNIRGIDWNNGELMWRATFDAKIIGDPAIYPWHEGGVAMIATEKPELIALDLQKGRVLWRKTGDDLPGAIYGNVTLADDGLAYAATSWGRLLVIEPWSGNTKWSLDLSSEKDEFYLPPAVTAAGVFIVSNKNAVIAVDRLKQERVWRQTFEVGFVSPPTAIENAGIVLIGAENNRVLALSTLSGKEAWTAQSNSRITGIASDWGRVYLTCDDGSVQVFEAKDGKVKWLVRVPNGITFAPLTDSARLLVVDVKGGFYTFDVDTGLELFERRLALDVNEGLQSPVPLDGWLFVQSGKEVRAFAP